MRCQRPTLLLASLLLAAAGSAQSFMIVFEAGSGESTQASTREFSASSNPFLFDDFTSALEPLFHPVSWLEEQLQAADALQQAALENLLIEQMEGLGLRDADMQPQELESEMLHKVGCQRFAPAMHEQASSSVVTNLNPWDADDWTETDMPVTQGDDAGSQAGGGARSQAEPYTDLYAQEQAASYINSYLQQTSRVFADDQAGVYTEGGESLSEADAATLSAWFEDIAEAGADASEGVREDAATLAAWFDDVNADARSDVVDLLTLSAYTHGPEVDEADDATAAAVAAVAGLIQQRRGSQDQGQNQDLTRAAFTLLPLRGAASEQAWPQPGEQEEQLRSAEVFSDPMVYGSLQADASLFLQEDEDDDLFAWPDHDHDPGMLRHNMYARMLDQLLMLRSLFWPLASQRTQGAGSGFEGGSGGSGAFLSWYDEPLLASEHFTEEDLAAGLTTEAGGRQGDGRYESTSDAAASGAGASAGTAAAAAAVAASVGSYWLDLNNDGLPDVKLAMREAETDTESGAGDRVPLGGGVEVTEGAWRRFLLAVLLTATVAMAAFFVRALLQLRDAMAAGADGAALGRAGHVLVPVTLERDGRLVHGLMLLPEEEADVMGALEQGKGTLVGEWQTDGKGCKAGDAVRAGKGQQAAEGWEVASRPAREQQYAGAMSLTEPLLPQQEGCEDEEAAEGIVVAAHYAAQAQHTRRP